MTDEWQSLTHHFAISGHIAQNSAWHLSHRIRATLFQGGTGFAGPVEVDETYIGGKRKNIPNSVRKELTGRGPVGKAAVVGAKDRETNQEHW